MVLDLLVQIVNRENRIQIGRLYIVLSAKFQTFEVKNGNARWHYA